MTNRSVFAGLALALVALVPGCYEKPPLQANTTGVIFRSHFLGTAQWAQTTNAGKWPKIWALPATTSLREAVLKKLARTPPAVWRGHVPAEAADQAPLVRPLLEDLLKAESYIEVRGPVERPEWVLTVELNEARAKGWQDNLRGLAAAWKFGTPAELKLGQSTGWECKQPGTAQTLQVLRAGKWVFVSWSAGQPKLLPTLAEQTAKTGRPVPALKDQQLDLEVNWPCLSVWFPGLAQWRLPPLHLSVAGRGEILRTEAELRFTEPIGWKFEPWKVPTNSISEPLITFTVGRGLAPILRQTAWFNELKLQDVPNQFCVWGQAHSFAITWFAAPVDNASRALGQLALTLPPVTDKYLPGHGGEFVWVSNRAEIILNGLPYMVPTVATLRDSKLEFVQAGLFPFRSKTNQAAPAELFGQFLKRDDVLYYDWELTGERLTHGRQLYQLFDIAHALKFAGTNEPTQHWLGMIKPLLGNAITEISVVSPRELKLVRRSDIGLTSFELATLARWIESPNFPLRFERPPRMSDVARQRAMQRTNAPAGTPPPRPGATNAAPAVKR